MNTHTSESLSLVESEISSLREILGSDLESIKAALQKIHTRIQSDPSLGFAISSEGIGTIVTAMGQIKNETIPTPKTKRKAGAAKLEDVGDLL